ncbi:MAG TPA: SgcJ/EcaC family oxidoreductase [Streptomyces sp.]|uniref:SgcJ/EcaC family oxidoreductase n=1 Tax=Streptomyces sp. TaxID=1931 RepID=UPI002B9A13ED|nr:SgcJ/EcaC family oxidoreductase [Streptomyces sp.]HWU11095.1 SgcJ/EcaC family oxidoreductase [Streptomyces sp.]
MNPTSTTATADTRDGFAGLPERIMAAWAAHDADAFADVFTENASMVMPGVHCQGRESIRTFMAAAFKGPYRGTQVVGAPVEVNVLSEEAAVLVTEGGVRAAGEDTVRPERRVRASWVAVRGENGRWSLAAYQNSPYDAA